MKHIDRWAIKATTAIKEPDADWVMSCDIKRALEETHTLEDLGKLKEQFGVETKVTEFDEYDWQLYHKFGWVEVNQLLTDAYKEYCELARLLPESNYDKAVWVRNMMYALMNTYTSYGARDTEPECYLVSSLEFEFGLDNYSLER